jgi:hypothetical protein
LIFWGIASHLESLAHMRARISRQCPSSGRDELGMGSSNSYGQTATNAVLTRMPCAIGLTQIICRRVMSNAE